MCVEAWHTFSDTNETLKQAKSLLDESKEESRFVIADGFSLDRLTQTEAEFNEHFEIESKTDISYNVRSARYLDVERQNKIVAHTLQNYDFLK